MGPIVIIFLDPESDRGTGLFDAAIFRLERLIFSVLDTNVAV